MWIDGNKNLPSFTDFFWIMQQSSELHGLEARGLLRSLYEIAKRKRIREAAAKLSRYQVQQLRRQRRDLSILRNHLEKASVHLQAACGIEPALLLEVENRLPSDVRVSKYDGQVSPLGEGRHFEHILKELKAAIDPAQEFADLRAVLIHPSSRTPKERRTAKEWFSKFGREETEDYLPIGPNSSVIDHWFIGTANACLLEFESQFRARLSVKNRLSILSQLFKVLFKERRTEESIRKELKRQERTGIPRFTWPARIEIQP